MAMTKEHREILQGNHVMFVENLILTEELMAVLVAERILTSSLLEKVQAEKTRSERVRKLLFTLTSRGDRAYTVFLKALIESRQDYLASSLDRVTANKFIEERDREESERPRPAQVEVQSSFDIRWQPANSSVDEVDTVWYDRLFKTNTKELGVELKQMAPDRKKHIGEMMNSKKAYDLTTKAGVFGRAVIINNVDYQVLPLRPSSNVDCEELKNLFAKLHFQPVVHKDLAEKEMRRTLKEERDKENQLQYSSFVLCILSHGSENKVYGTDGYESSGAIDIREITSWFSASNCPGLAGKPKLFFIQACQGGQDMIAVSLNNAKALESSGAGHGPLSDGGGHAKAVRVDHLLPQSDARPETAPRQQISEKNPSHHPLHTPEVADVLVAYSTAPGYKSWRHPQFGTWFIRCLIYVILNNACEDHILDMLTQVAFIISHFKVKYERNEFAVQVPQIVSTLTKKVYFMP